MARIRTIKPQFWIDENLGTIRREARLLYIGLWNLADDQGVFEYRPARIKAQLFPYDLDITGKDIAEWLNLLEQSGDVVQFSANGDNYGYIPSFLKHQEIKNPSQWHFAELPEDLVTKNDTTPALPQQGVSPTPALPVGNREKESIVGNRESIVDGDNLPNKVIKPFPKETETFEDYKDVLRADPRFTVLNFDDELEKFYAYWQSNGRKLKNHKLALLNWMTKAKEIQGNGKHDREIDPDKFTKGRLGHAVNSTKEDFERLKALRQKRNLEASP